MTTISPAGIFPRFIEFRCPDCSSQIGYRSRRRNFSERYLLPIFLLMPVRCAACFRRDYRVIFTQVRDRSQDLPRPVSAMKAATETRNVA